MKDLFGPNISGYKDGKPQPKEEETWPATNSGFVHTNRHKGCEQFTMDYFELGTLSIVHQMAQDFVVCDNWFCDFPGHTNPNRAFMHCATDGNVQFDSNASEIDSKTIYQLLCENGRSSKMYARTNKYDAVANADWEWVINVPQSARASTAEFVKDVGMGTLPFYSFVSCFSPRKNLDGSVDQWNTSMHPAAHVEAGENYLAAIYNKLRASQLWNKTLLVVTFDENGGYYDHVRPPKTVSPDPEHKTQDFDYTLLGPRIPALLVSPWLSKGKVDSTQYQNTSILRYVENAAVGSPNSRISLTARDASARSIGCAFELHGVDEARTDCPEQYPYYQGVGGHNLED
jgi:phospholipase C